MQDERVFTCTFCTKIGKCTTLVTGTAPPSLDLQTNRSIATDNGKEIGECVYAISENGWNIYHTGVSPQYEGKGIAKRLVYKVIEAAERNCVNITATCSDARKVLEE